MPPIRRALLFSSLAAVVAGCPGPSPSADCKGRLPGDLVISEFMKDPAGIDKGKEYVELYNATSSSIPLKGFVLYAAKIDGSAERTAVFDTPVSIPPQSYFVAGDAPFDALPAWADYGYGESLGDLGGTSGLIGVRCGETVLDEVKYAEAGKSGAARIFDGDLVPDSAGNDSEANWCDAELEFAPGSLGSPRMANAPCGGGPGSTCKEPGTGQARAVVPPLNGQLVITEVMANPAGTDSDREWFEVLAKADVDLNGLVVGNEGSGKTTLPKTGCLRLRANEYALFAHKTDAGVNGGLPTVTATFGFALTQAADGGVLAVRNGQGDLIDFAPYRAPTEGVAFQLKTEQLNAVANDQLVNYCPASRGYPTPDAGNYGTPGAPNSECVATGNPVTCRDAVSGTTRAIVSPEAGDLVISELISNPRGIDTDVEWFEVFAKRPVDFNNLLVRRDATDTGAISSPDCLTAQANDYLIFAKHKETDGGFPAVFAAFPFEGSLGNTGLHTISILAPDAGVIDVASYEGGPDGKSWQLSQNAFTEVGNDTPTNFCAAKTADAGNGNLGTPGAPNESCP